MSYQVMYVTDDSLPPSVDWAFAATRGTTYFFIKASRVTPEVLADAWRTWEARRNRRSLSGLYSIASMSPTAANA